MVDTGGMDFGSRFWMYKKHSLLVQILGQQGYYKQTSLSTKIARVYINTWFDKTQTPTVFLVNTQLSSKKLSRPLWTSYHATDIIAENPHSSSSLIAITYMINKLKHDILDSSKLLTSIKLLKTMIYKNLCKHFIPLPHVQHIFWSNQTPINLFKQLSKQI